MDGGWYPSCSESNCYNASRADAYQSAATRKESHYDIFFREVVEYPQVTWLNLYWQHFLCSASEIRLHQYRACRSCLAYRWQVLHTGCITVALLNDIIVIDREVGEQKGDPHAELEFVVISSLYLRVPVSAISMINVTRLVMGEKRSWHGYYGKRSN